VSFAIRGGTLEILKLLLQDKRTTFYKGSLRLAVELHCEEMGLLLYPIVDQNSKSPEIFNLAVEKRQQKLVQVMLQDPSIVIFDQSGTALIFATKMGDYDLVKTLSEHPSNNNTVSDDELLKIAIENGQEKIAEYLLNEKLISKSLLVGLLFNKR
jgi:ankyrin repeat protein